jgi:hypothetical protein
MDNEGMKVYIGEYQKIGGEVLYTGAISMKWWTG